MKICILSMQHVNNFGSLLQSYALKKLIESYGHTVSFIDIEYRDNDNRLLEGKCMTFSEENETKTSSIIFGKLKKIDRYAINRIKIKRKAQKQNIIFHQFREKTLEISQNDNYGKYDICVIGSDEVFNCLSDSSWGFTTQLFGNVNQSHRVITYAACCGTTNYGMLTDKIKNEIREAFRRIECFSVRDNNTCEFVDKLADKKAQIHLDPVLIGDFENEMSNIKPVCGLPKRFCIVYSYYNRINDSKSIIQIKDFCQKHDMEIVAVGAPQMWIKQYIVLSPFEMLSVFKRADMVITDTFHGTIFSAKYANRFAVMTRASNANKLSDLIHRLKLERHLVNDMSELESVYNEKKDNSALNEIISAERVRTKEYIQSAINGR